MASRRSRKRQARRDRRKAKLSGWKRQPKGRKVGHGTSLGDTVEGGPVKVTKRGKKKDRRIVRVVGPEVESPFAALRDREESERGERDE